MTHTVYLENKNKLTVTGITEMGYYDDTSVTAVTDFGEINIKGENIRINRIDTETGDLFLTGDIYVIGYSESRKEKGGFFSGLFK